MHDPPTTSACGLLRKTVTMKLDGYDTNQARCSVVDGDSPQTHLDFNPVF
jgi:hypothetical protein